MPNTTPLERHEQATFVQWLEQHGLLFSATAQSTYTTSYNQKRINYQTGLRKGVPDMLVLVDASKSRDGLGYCLFIEMKRTKGGVVSSEQKTWLATINGLNAPQTHAYVAKGAQEAITIVSHYLKQPNTDTF